MFNSYESFSINSAVFAHAAILSIQTISYIESTDGFTTIFSTNTFHLHPHQHLNNLIPTLLLKWAL